MKRNRKAKVEEVETVPEIGKPKQKEIEAKERNEKKSDGYHFKLTTDTTTD